MKHLRGRQAITATLSLSGNQMLSSSRELILGSQSGSGLTTGADNTLLGPLSGAKLTTGSRNVFIGDGAGPNATTSSDCIVFGTSAAGAMTTADNVIVAGTSAMAANQTCDDVVALGFEALKAATDCTGAVAIGGGAVDKATTFTNSVAIGGNALGETTQTIDKACALGSYAGYDVASAPTECCFLGTEAGRESSGTQNCYMGYRAGYQITGSKNTLLGRNAGGNFAATSSSNVCIGAFSGPSSSTAESNKLYIHAASTYAATNLVEGDFSANTLSFGGAFTVSDDMLDISDTDNPEFELHNTTEEDTDGGRESAIYHYANTDGATELAKWLISHEGTGTDEKGQLTISVNATTDTVMTIDSTTDIVMPGDLSCNSYTETSDEQLKERIRPLEDVGALARRLNPLTYLIGGNKRAGFSAQAVRGLFPEVVRTTRRKGMSDMLTVDVTGLIAIAVKYAQELNPSITSKPMRK